MVFAERGCKDRMLNRRRNGGLCFVKWFFYTSQSPRDMAQCGNRYNADSMCALWDFDELLSRFKCDCCLDEISKATPG